MPDCGRSMDGRPEDWLQAQVTVYSKTKYLVACGQHEADAVSAEFRRLTRELLPKRKAAKP